LTVLEIVLGIDNLVFVSILTSRLPADRQVLARRVGLGLAMGMRIALLFSIAWIIGLTAPLFEVFGHEFSGRDIILLLGGLFLLGKSVTEINERLEGHQLSGGRAEAHNGRRASFAGVIVQIVLLDAVFSLDSVITAVGLADQVAVMATAIVIAVLIMMFSIDPIAKFIQSHPTIVILALSFLLLIGMSLVAEGLDFHIPKGYIYFAMGFAILVEVPNLRVREGARATREEEQEERKAL
jgi:predicted tellurium resistance membrane protein TerC